MNDDLEIHFLELKKIIGLKRKPQNDLEEWLLYFNNAALFQQYSG